MSGDAPTTHRFFAPSAASRWLFCTASAVSPRDEVDRPSPSGLRGTHLHAVSETVLRTGVDGPDGPNLSPDDRDSVQRYVDFVRSRPGSKIYEAQSDFIDGLCGGTADCVVFSPPVLEIIDYKSGTTFVDPVDNWQLTIYALGVLRKFQALIDSGYKVARLTIAQPALGNFNSWTVGLAELQERGEFVQAKVDEIMRGEVEFSPSEDRCRWCPRKASCPALEGFARAAARDDFAEFVTEKPSEVRAVGRAAESGPHPLTLAERLDLVPYLRHWIKAVEAEARGELLRGGDVPGWKVVRGRKGNRQWTNQKEALAAMQAAGFDEPEIYSEPVMVTPPQAEKVAKSKGLSPKEVKAALGKAITEGAPGAPTVVPESDSRPAMSSADLAKRDFGLEDK